MMSVYVVRRESFELDDAEVNRIVATYLTDITKGRWVENGKLREEVYTSHRFDMDCKDQSDLRVVEAIQILLEELKKRTKTSGI